MKVTYYFAVAGILCIFASGHALLLRSCTDTHGDVYIVPAPYRKDFAEGGKARLYLIIEDTHQPLTSLMRWDNGRDE